MAVSLAPARCIAAFEAPEEGCLQRFARSPSTDGQRAGHVSGASVTLFEGIGEKDAVRLPRHVGPERAVTENRAARRANGVVGSQ